MNTDKDVKLAESFREYLEERGYGNHILISNYRYTNCDYPDWHKKIDVKDGSKVIQAFILMSAEERMKLKKYSFHRAYKQMADEKTNIFPACYVASLGEDEKWHFFNCNCLDYELDPDRYADLVDYDKAKNRFWKRWNAVSSVRRAKCLRYVSLTLAACGLTVLLFNGLLNLSDAILIATAAVTVMLIIVAILAPGIRSISVGGNGVCVTED